MSGFQLTTTGLSPMTDEVRHGKGQEQLHGL